MTVLNQRKHSIGCQQQAVAVLSVTLDLRHRDTLLAGFKCMICLIVGIYMSTSSNPHIRKSEELLCFAINWY